MQIRCWPRKICWQKNNSRSYLNKPLTGLKAICCRTWEGHTWKLHTTWKTRMLEKETASMKVWCFFFKAQCILSSLQFNEKVFHEGTCIPKKKSYSRLWAIIEWCSNDIGWEITIFNGNNNCQVFNCVTTVSFTPIITIWRGATRCVGF